MAAHSAQKIDYRTQQELHDSSPPLKPTVKHARRRADSSQVAAMQRRIETAALQGFFYKHAAPRWRSRGSRAALVVGVAVGVWIAIFAIVSAGMN